MLLSDFSEISWSVTNKRTKRAVRALEEQATACANDYDAFFDIRNTEMEKAVPLFHPNEVILDEKSMKVAGFFAEYELIRITADEGSKTKLEFANSSNDGNYSVKFLSEYILDSDHATNATAEMILETKILMSLAPHPHLCKIYGVTEKGIGSLLHEGLSRYFFVTDLVAETLGERMDAWREQHGCSDNDETALAQRAEVALHIASALVYLHDHKLVFYIRPDKVGFDQRYGRVKLFNFGESRQIGMKSHPRSVTQTDDIRKLAFTAPEVLCKAPANLISDVYGFGIMLWEMMSLEQAFVSFDRTAHFEKVVKSNERPLILSDTWPRDICEVLQSCWDPYKRPTMKKVHSILETVLLSSKDDQELESTYDDEELELSVVSQSGEGEESLSSIVTRETLRAVKQHHSDNGLLSKVPRAQGLKQNENKQNRTNEEPKPLELGCSETTEPAYDTNIHSSEDEERGSAHYEEKLAEKSSSEQDEVDCPTAMLKRTVSKNLQTDRSIDAGPDGASRKGVRRQTSSRQTALRTRRGIKKSLSADRLEDLIPQEEPKSSARRRRRGVERSLSADRLENNFSTEWRSSMGASIPRMNSLRQSRTKGAVGRIERERSTARRASSDMVTPAAGGVTRTVSDASDLWKSQVAHTAERGESILDYGAKEPPERAASDDAILQTPSWSKFPRDEAPILTGKKRFGGLNRLASVKGFRKFAPVGDDDSPNGNKDEKASVPSRRRMNMQQPYSFIQDDDLPTNDEDKREQSSVRPLRRMSMHQLCSSIEDELTKREQQTPTRSRRKMSMQHSYSSVGGEDLPNNDNKREQASVRLRRKMSMRSSSFSDDDNSRNSDNKREQASVRSSSKMGMRSSSFSSDDEDSQNNGNKCEPVSACSRRKLSMRTSSFSDDDGDSPNNGNSKRDQASFRSSRKMSMNSSREPDSVRSQRRKILMAGILEEQQQNAREGQKERKATTKPEPVRRNLSRRASMH